MRLAGPLVLVALLLVGCGSDPEVLDGKGNHHVLVGGSSRGGEDALITGTVTMAGTCLGVADTRGATYVVVWPSGTEIVVVGDDGVSADPKDRAIVIDVPNVGRLTEGDEVALAGGYHRPPLPDRVPDLPDGCPDDEVAVANSDQSR